MIYYKSLVKDVIEEMIVYLENQKSKVKDVIDLKVLVSEIEKLKKVATNPIRYSDYIVRFRENLIVDLNGLYDVAVLYGKVMWHAGKLDSKFRCEREFAEKNILDAYKAMKVKNTKNVFEKLKLNLQNPEKIAQNVKQR